MKVEPMVRNGRHVGPMPWMAASSGRHFALDLSNNFDLPAMSATNVERCPFLADRGCAIVRDLFVADERIYWIDFLTTILVGYAAFALARLPFDLHLEPQWLRWTMALAAFSIQCACFYRAVMFVHEIVHLPEKKFAAFRVVWNLLCGIPFLVPSFTYYTHLDHHRRTMFGTDGDGEYLPLASLSPWWIVVYLSQCLWVPPLAVIRFGVLTPLTWISPTAAALDPSARLVARHGPNLYPAAADKDVAARHSPAGASLFFLLACAL